MGQLFAEGSCTGDASELTWQEALQEADGSEWRLPKINELSTIVEECRHASTINPEIFPDSPSFYFLSSSPVAMEDPSLAMVWTVNFNSGSEVANSRATTAWVRLVRDIE